MKYNNTCTDGITVVKIGFGVFWSRQRPLRVTFLNCGQNLKRVHAESFMATGNTYPLSPLRNAQCVHSHFRYLPFDPAAIKCLALPEIIAGKIRTCYQQSKAPLLCTRKRSRDREFVGALLKSVT